MADPDPEPSAGASRSTGARTAPRDDAAELARLRAEIDAIDTAIHDLLIRRAATVTAIGAAKGKGPAMRPAREATVLRRILGRHHGALPGAAIGAFWREIIGAHTAMQGTQIAAVLPIEVAPGVVETARDHLGAAVALRPFASAAEVMQRVAEGGVPLGILPWPRDGGPDPWWSQLGAPPFPGLRLIWRLPFVPPAPDVFRDAAAGIATVEPEPSGDDVSYLLLGAIAGMPRADVATAARASGLDAHVLAFSAPTTAADPLWAFAEVNGFVAADDPRIRSLVGGTLRTARRLGACPRPLPTGTVAATAILPEDSQ